MTDLRLLRRMVRDNRTRGYSPSVTLGTWMKVRSGEEKHVFPYQDNADALFNTSQAYDLSVLKRESSIRGRCHLFLFIC